MNIVDMDRNAWAQEHHYSTSLLSLNPLGCTPKNNIIVGIPPKW
jgi:hypothetical protein